MQRKTKLILFIMIFLISIGLLVVTIIYAKNNLKAETNDVLGAMMAQTTDTSTTPPDKPDGEDGTTQPEIMTIMQQTSTQTVTLTTIYIVAIALETLLFVVSLSYIIGSKFCSINIFVNKDKIIIFILLSLIITAGLTFGIVYLTNNYILSTGKESNNTMTSTQNTSVDSKGSYEINGETITESDKTYSSENSDENTILVTNGGNLTLTNATINKLGGDTSNTENSEFYGVNAAILAQAGSTITLSDSTISTSAKGSNAIFATGTNAKIYVSNTKITTTSDSSRGLDSTYGGYIEADKVTISTQGGSCATLATDRGEGTVIAKNSTLSTAGSGSPIIYSTGNIQLSNSTGDATGAQLVVIEGKNSATVTDSTLTSSGKGNRGDVDNAGVMVYQSMSGDAGEGTGTFTATDSDLSITSDSSVYDIAPMFFVTNTTAVINLENTKLSYGSGNLLTIEGTDQWGNSGSNGGIVTFNATSQELKGNINVDNISTLEINLIDSVLTGAINTEDTAKSITLNLDSDSVWDVTGTSYVTIITGDNSDFNNIESNGYTIYYDSNSNTQLNGKTITLSGGGKLVAK